MSADNLSWFSYFFHMLHLLVRHVDGLRHSVTLLRDAGE